MNQGATEGEWPSRLAHDEFGQFRRQARPVLC